MWGQYRGDFAVFKLSVSRTPLEVIRVGRKLPSNNIAPGTGLGQAKSREPEAQAACDGDDAKLATVNSNANEVVEFRRR